MKPSKDHLARARKICLALPEATEKTAWGAPTFRVGGKMFAMFADNHHKDGRIALWLHAKVDTQALLVDSDPTRFFIPPYVGKGGWIGVNVDKSPDALIADCVRRAYLGVAPKRLRTEGHATEDKPEPRARQSRAPRRGR